MDLFFFIKCIQAIFKITILLKPEGLTDIWQGFVKDETFLFNVNNNPKLSNSRHFGRIILLQHKFQWTVNLRSLEGLLLSAIAKDLYIIEKLLIFSRKIYITNNG